MKKDIQEEYAMQFISMQKLKINRYFNFSFCKNYGKCGKTCNNRKDKKLFNIITKVSYYEVFHRNVMTTEMGKAQIFMNKPVYLGTSTIDLSKTVMYEFWYDYVKSKHGEKAKGCYLDTDSFIVYMKTDYIYIDIAVDVETRFDTLNFQLDIPLPKG